MPGYRMKPNCIFMKVVENDRTHCILFDFDKMTYYFTNASAGVILGFMSTPSGIAHADLKGHLMAQFKISADKAEKAIAKVVEFKGVGNKALLSKVKGAIPKPSGPIKVQKMMAEEYADPQINVQGTVQSLGIIKVLKLFY